MYLMEFGSGTVEISKKSVYMERCSPHTITGQLTKRPPPVLNSSFSSSVVPFALRFARLHSRLCLAYFPSPYVMPPKTLGPWKLETVKRRLQSEQVARERAAEVRYGQLEDENKDQNQEAANSREGQQSLTRNE